MVLFEYAFLPRNSAIKYSRLDQIIIVCSVSHIILLILLCVNNFALQFIIKGCIYISFTVLYTCLFIIYLHFYVGHGLCKLTIILVHTHAMTTTLQDFQEFSLCFISNVDYVLEYVQNIFIFKQPFGVFCTDTMIYVFNLLNKKIKK